MSRYRRLLIEGGAFFFTLALADRRSDLLVRRYRALAPRLRRDGKSPSVRDRCHVRPA